MHDHKPLETQMCHSYMTDGADNSKVLEVYVIPPVISTLQPDRG